MFVLRERPAVPSTGIIDSHAFMLALRGDAEVHGTMFVFGTPVISGLVADDGLVLETDGRDPLTIRGANRH